MNSLPLSFQRSQALCSQSHSPVPLQAALKGSASLHQAPALRTRIDINSSCQAFSRGTQVGNLPLFSLELAGNEPALHVLALQGFIPPTPRLAPPQRVSTELSQMCMQLQWQGVATETATTGMISKATPTGAKARVFVLRHSLLLVTDCFTHSCTAQATISQEEAKAEVAGFAHVLNCIDLRIGIAPEAAILRQGVIL